MIIFKDGFDYITVANGLRKWDVASGSIVTGVYGLGSALQGAAAKTKILPATYAHGFFSFHWFSGTLADHLVFAVIDGGSFQVELRCDVTGKLRFTRNNTLLGSASTLQVVSNTWYFIDGEIVIDNSAGVANVNVDRVSFVSLTSQDTQNSANAFFGTVEINGSANNTQRHDNFHVWDNTAGDLAAAPTGELVVDTAWVTGAGGNADFTPLSSTNASNVDDNPNSDDDTTYNSSGTVGHIDTFAVGNLHASSGTVLSVAVNTIDRRDDATLFTVKHRVKSSSATADGTGFTPSASYTNHQSHFATDPNTSAAWTVSGRNAANFGYKIDSSP
jgi:hypothetical protein